jgi:hypothetical protein
LTREVVVVVAGVALLLIGLLLGISWLWIIGLVLVVLGAVGNFGYARPRRSRYWY